ncbi:MAG: YraN family protein [Chloroflexota bacterium]|nr:YraN family protein [Chloroflexota bacterium]
MPDPRHMLGQQGEEVAAAWLATRGWTVMARRWRCPVGELDLVALDPGGVLVAIEVKVRRSARAGDPRESVDRKRLLRLRAALGQFRARLGRPIAEGSRIDLVAVCPAPDGRWRLAHHQAIDAW